MEDDGRERREEERGLPSKAMSRAAALEVGLDLMLDHLSGGRGAEPGSPRFAIRS